MVDASVAFLEPHLEAVRVPGGIEPGPFINTDRIHDKGVIPFPMSHRVSIPMWVG